MAASNGLDKMSYVQLLALQERVEEAIATNVRKTHKRPKNSSE